MYVDQGIYKVRRHEATGYARWLAKHNMFSSYTELERLGNIGFFSPTWEAGTLTDVTLHALPVGWYKVHIDGMRGENYAHCDGKSFSGFANAEYWTRVQPSSHDIALGHWSSLTFVGVELEATTPIKRKVGWYEVSGGEVPQNGKTYFSHFDGSHWTGYADREWWLLQNKIDHYVVKENYWVTTKYVGPELLQREWLPLSEPPPSIGVYHVARSSSQSSAWYAWFDGEKWGAASGDTSGAYRYRDQPWADGPFESAVWKNGSRVTDFKVPDEPKVEVKMQPIPKIKGHDASKCFVCKTLPSPGGSLGKRRARSSRRLLLLLRR